MADQVIIVPAADTVASSGTHAPAANTSVLIAAANPLRNTLIVSPETADVWLFYGAGPAVVGVGVCVHATDDPWVESEWKGAVYAISAGSAVIGTVETEISITSLGGEDTGYTPSGPSDTPIPAPTLWPNATPFPPQ
jgi:hypothetical protein